VLLDELVVLVAPVPWALLFAALDDAAPPVPVWVVLEHAATTPATDTRRLDETVTSGEKRMRKQ
jgi:hypothetical protein